MNSWPLMLSLWYAGRRREEPPPSSLYGTLLCRWGKQKHKQKGGRESSASRQKHFLRCTSCGWSQRSASWSHCSTFFLPTSPIYFLTSFFFGLVMSLLPRCCGVTGRQRILLAASPVDTVVMSLPSGSTIGHPRPPQWAASLVYSVGELGGWATAGWWDGLKAKPPQSAPLHAPAEVNDWELVWENGAEVADFTHLPDSEPKPLCHSAPTDKLSDQCGNRVHTTTKDARFHLTRITHQRPCNKLNYNQIIPLYYISRCITKTQAWGI